MRTWRQVGVLAVALVGGLAVAASGSSDGESGGATKPGEGSKEHPAVDDVTITSCSTPDNEFLGPETLLEIVNHSSKASNYIVEVAFESPDGTEQLDTGIALVNNVEPDQKATETASSLDSEIRGKEFKCRIIDVTRTASG
jgi:ABC-type glycerol-3-phosphate transport system substrate-binding protein